MLLPTSNPEEEFTETDNGSDNFSQNQVDLDDHDLGLSFQKVRAHQVLVQDLGEDPEHDNIESYDDLKFVPKFTPKKVNEQGNTMESEDCKDNGEWLLEQLDLTDLDDWSKDLQEEAKNMLRRIASIFSKHDLVLYNCYVKMIFHKQGIFSHVYLSL